MRREYFIAMDTHCRTTDTCIKTGGGKLVRREHTPTTIPQLREIIESAPRSRRVTFEESSMAGWLYRNLKEVADEVVVCDGKLCRLVKDNVMMRLVAELPGYGPVRAQTLVVYWETPWRFKSNDRAAYIGSGAGVP